MGALGDVPFGDAISPASSGPSVAFTHTDCRMDSPIERIPIETLGVIFHFILDGHRLRFPRRPPRYATVTSIEDPPVITLGQVCLLWRACTLSIGEFWNKFNIYLTSEVIQRGLQAILDRSTTTPLDLCIYDALHRPQESVPILRAVVRESKRWKKVVISPDLLIRWLETSRPDPDRLHDLSQLCHFEGIGNPSDFRGESQLAFLENAPNLRWLRLSQYRPPTRLRAPTLHTLDLSGGYVQRDLFPILEQCLSLSVLKLGMVPATWAKSGSNSGTSFSLQWLEDLRSRERLSILSIKRFEFKHQSQDNPSTQFLESIILVLEKLSFPLLEHLTVDVYRREYTTEWDGIRPKEVENVLLQLLSRTSAGSLHGLSLKDQVSLLPFSDLHSITSLELSMTSETQLINELTSLTVHPSSESYPFPNLQHLTFRSPRADDFDLAVPRMIVGDHWEHLSSPLRMMLESRNKMQSVVVKAWIPQDLEKGKRVLKRRLAGLCDSIVVTFEDEL